MFGVQVVKRQQARQHMAAKLTSHQRPRSRSVGNDAARAKQMNDLRKWAFEGIQP